MTQASQLIAKEAYEQALKRGQLAARKEPIIMTLAVNSRVADKFVCRGFPAVWDAIETLGQQYGRSQNAECVAAIVDALAGNERSMAMISLLKRCIGEDASQSIISELPVLEVEGIYRNSPKFVVRFPDNVREAVRQTASDIPGMSMNTWCINAFVRWVNIQRQYYALLSAAIAMDPALTGKEV